VRGALGRRQAHGLHADGRASPTAITTSRARSRHSRDEKVRVICHYMGGNFGNKNQNQDADLITAVLAREAGAPVKLEFSRKDDFIGMHGRWADGPVLQGGREERRAPHGHPAANHQQHGPYRKNSWCPSAASSSTTATTPRARCSRRTRPDRTTPANFRGPSDPQGYYPIQSHMDDIAYAMKMDPVDFILKNMVKPGPGTVFTNYTLDECVRRAAELFEWKKRWKPEPGSGPGPIKRGAGVASWRSVLPSARAALSSRWTRSSSTRCFVGVTDVGPGAKTTMNIIAADELRRAALEGQRRLGRHRHLPVLGG